MGSGGRQNEDGLRTQRGARGQSRGRRWGAGTQGQGLGGRKRRKGRPALSVAKQDGGCHRGRPPRAAAASPAPACRRRLIRGRPRRSRPRRLLQGREVSRPGHRPAGRLTRPRRRAAAGPPGSQHHYLSPRGAWCLREWPPCLRRASSNRMPQRGPHASCRCPRTGFQGPQGHPGGPQPLPERASGCPPPPTAHTSVQRSGLAADR